MVQLLDKLSTPLWKKRKNPVSNNAGSFNNFAPSLSGKPCACLGVGNKIKISHITGRSIKKPTAARIVVYWKCFDKMPSNKGMPNAPIPKNTPSRLRLAPLFSALISATRALVPPLIIPPPKPVKKMHIYNKDNELVNAKPSSEIAEIRMLMISYSL